jgi:hypothetical protein
MPPRVDIISLGVPELAEFRGRRRARWAAVWTLGLPIEQSRPRWSAIALRHATGRPGGQTRGGLSTGWDLVRGIAQIPDTPFITMRMRGQLPTAEIVDSHNLLCRPVREVIVHYLEERRPALDYSTFYTQAHVLAAFWADLEAHNPGIDSLHLSDDVAEAWRQRIRTVVNRNGTIRRRRSSLNLFVPNPRLLPRSRRLGT